MAKPPYSKRLKEARDRSGLSQRQLGIQAGIDPFVASTRMNRYERGVHEPDVQTMRQIARAAKLPLAYFYAEEDELAELILKYASLTVDERRRWLRALSL